MWDSCLKLIAGGMEDSAARVKLAELYAVDGTRADAIIGGRGDPDRSDMNAMLRERAFRKRVIVDVESTGDGAKVGAE